MINQNRNATFIPEVQRNRVPIYAFDFRPNSELKYEPILLSRQSLITHVLLVASVDKGPPSLDREMRGYGSVTQFRNCIQEVDPLMESH